MDERVEKAMQQWPDVPDVYGWLSLDARGRWKLRGEPITNPNLIDFINRNYMRNDNGSYVFQNGPQKVHVALDATPWVAFLTADEQAACFELHTGSTAEKPRRVYLAKNGGVILSLPRGPALLHDQDLVAFLPHLRDVDGQALADTDLEKALAQPRNKTVTLQTKTGLVSVAPLPDDTLENIFRFIAHPKAQS